jgi:hypothetical protein
MLPGTIDPHVPSRHGVSGAAWAGNIEEQEDFWFYSIGGATGMAGMESEQKGKYVV